MLYLGHFSFDEICDDDEGKFGHFTCMVEVENIEKVENAFKKLLQDMRKKKALFTEPAHIYLDTFIEIGTLPANGVVTEYASYSRENAPSRICTYLPHEDRGECQPYFWSPDDRPDIAAQIDSTESVEDVPFISFEPTAAQKRKAALLKEQKEREQTVRLAVPKKRNPFSRKHHW